MPRYSDAPGKIYALNLPSGVDPIELHIEGDFDAASFGPHGISVYTDDGMGNITFIISEFSSTVFCKKALFQNPVTDGTRYLFVVNHPHDNSQVEIFQYVEEDSTLVHVKTIKHELLHKYVHPNRLPFQYLLCIFLAEIHS